MAVRTRQDMFPCDTGIDATQIVPASKLVSGITGYPVQPNKAIVGANAFAHESGIHQDGVLKHRETYEIMSAEAVGWNANRLTLGKLSGRNAFRTRLQELGIELASEEALNAAFKRFKDLADKKREIFDEDLQALITEEGIDHVESEHYRLVSLTAHSETGEQPYAKIVVAENGEERRSEAQGSGPVDASFKAIEADRDERRGAAALLGQQHHDRHRRPGRSDRAPRHATGASSTARAPTPTSWSPRPRRISTR